MSHLLTADYHQKRSSPASATAVAAAARISASKPRSATTLSPSSSELVTSSAGSDDLDSESDSSSLVGGGGGGGGKEHEEAGRKKTEEEEEAEAQRKAKEALEARRLIAKLGTVEDLWINPEEVRFDSDGEVSDVSEIWSQYGDEVEPEVTPRLHKWNPLRKHLSDKISLKDQSTRLGSEKGRKKSKRKKPGGDGGSASSSSSRRRSTISQDPQHHGMSFVPIGSQKEKPKGVYFLEFSSHFKRSLR